MARVKALRSEWGFIPGRVRGHRSVTASGEGKWEGQGLQKPKEELKHRIDVGVGKQGTREPNPDPPPYKMGRTGLCWANGRIRAYSESRR